MPPSDDLLAGANIYRCHDYFFAGERGLTGFTAFLVAITWLLPLASLASGAAVAAYPLRLALYLSFTLCCVLLLSLAINRKIKQLRYIVAKGALMRIGSTSRREVRFASAIALRRGPWGMIELRSPTEAIRIPLIVANLPRLIDDIQEGLIGAGNLAALESGAANAVRIDAVVNERSAVRLQREFPRAWAAARLLFAFGLIVAHALWQWPLFLAVTWGVAGMIAPVAALAAADMLLSLRARAALRSGRDPAAPEEEGILIAAGAAALAAYLAAGIGARTGFAVLVGQ